MRLLRMLFCMGCKVYIFQLCIMHWQHEAMNGMAPSMHFCCFTAALSTLNPVVISLTYVFHLLVTNVLLIISFQILSMFPRSYSSCHCCYFAVSIVLYDPCLFCR
ncbi:hypothetical protein DFH29DRAFT_959731 [Suillus ampliporus]|nr:hypothetical protein DFH29DRAFT_959731 [Suillus ampliporus]